MNSECILLDTSFFIRLLNNKDPLHQNALGYYKYFLQNNFQLKTSTISIAEYCVKGKILELPLIDIQIIPFNMDHAIRSGELAKIVFDNKGSLMLPDRRIIPNDTKLFAQADIDNQVKKFATSDIECIKIFNLLKEKAKVKFEIIFFKPVLITSKIIMIKVLKSRTFQLLAIAIVLLTTVATTVVNTNSNYFEIAKNIEIFTNLYKEVNTGYVDELDPAKLMKTGVDAMLESLDPYTNYFSEGQVESWRFMTEGKYNGIGADIRIIGDMPTLVAPYKDAPADKAGLKAGDKILKIDGRDTEGKSVDEIHAFIKGYPGTEVKLTIQRPGEKKEMEVALVRDEVSVTNVPYSGMVSGDVGYVNLTTFTRDAGRNVASALKDLKVEQPNLKGLILDLRGNGGGLLAEAVNLSNVFVPKNELVVSTKGKVKDWDRSFKTLNAPVDEQVPLVVLINKNSASASEIVSGVIQDFDRGVLIGQRSYGKGLVQNTKDIGYNAKVKMTTAKYYIPSGRCIQAVEYHEGEPADIPDDKRTPFKTRNGRTVLDGGGVKPDILLDPDENSEILTILDEKNIVFNYVTEWILKNPEVTDAGAFHFTDWDGFVQFLELMKFNYDTESEELLDKLKDTAIKNHYLSAADIAALDNKIIAGKKDELLRHKDLIVNMIEKEIVSRYLYERGRVQIGLRNDKEIKEALNLFNDRARYDSILKGK